MTKILKLVNDCAADCPHSAYERGGYLCRITMQRGPWRNEQMIRMRAIPTEWTAPGKPATPPPAWCPLADYVPAGVPEPRRPLGCALAMRVIQSDLYRHLDTEQRAECDELIRQNLDWCNGTSGVPGAVPGRVPKPGPWPPAPPVDGGQKK
jgi:hypothetical protein